MIINKSKIYLFISLTSLIGASIVEIWCGRTHWGAGFLWGIFLVSTGNALIVLLNTKLLQDQSRVIASYVVRSLIRSSILISLFCFILFVLKIDSLGFLLGIGTALMLTTAVLIVDFKELFGSKSARITQK